MVEKFKMYNQTMYKLKCLLMTFTLALLPTANVFAEDTTADTAITAQQTACAANTAMEWSSTLNRCVTKAAAVTARKEAATCDAMTDATAKAACHLAVAEKSSSVSGDASKLNQGNTTASAIMNTAGVAYYAVDALNRAAQVSDISTSNCTSKNILGVTAVAGLVSDVYLKMTAKNKVKELQKKFTIDTTSGASEAQVQALRYLKEEQETVVKIAAMEKKRDALLMLGYGMAAAFAVYEMMGFGAANTDCSKPTGKEVKGSATTPTTETTSDPFAVKPEKI
jgi:hypothetical protein